MSPQFTHFPVTQQPKSATMVPTNHLPFNFNSDGAPRCDNGTGPQGQHKCSRFFFRRLILPAAMAACVLLAGLTAFSLAQGYLSLSDLELEGLFPRAISSTNNSNSPFVKNKLYLIVLFVGILVVVGLGISLAFWCCRGAFRNPLCCPCYLCACCGGLACLECIGCGLCAEAVEQI